MPRMVPPRHQFRTTACPAHLSRAFFLQRVALAGRSVDRSPAAAANQASFYPRSPSYAMIDQLEGLPRTDDRGDRDEDRFLLCPSAVRPVLAPLTPAMYAGFPSGSCRCPAVPLARLDAHATGCHIAALLHRHM